MTKSYLTLKNVMKALGLDLETIKKLIHQGWLTHQMTTSGPVFLKEDVLTIQKIYGKKGTQEKIDRCKKLEAVDLEQANFTQVALERVPRFVAEQYQIVPIRFEDDILVCACADPNGEHTFHDVTYVLQTPVRLLQADPTKVRQFIDRFYNSETRRNTSKLELNSSGDIERWYTDDESLGPRVFIAMPFDKRFDGVYAILKSAVAECGGRSLRIDQVPSLENIWEAILKEVERSDVVLADFTGDLWDRIPNPNVVTETTIGHYRYGHPVVIIAQTSKALYFDWRHHHAVIYDPSEEGLQALQFSTVNKLKATFTKLKNRE